MSKVVTMKTIKQREKEPESACPKLAEPIRQLLKTMRPYDVAWMASEVIARLHEYTRDETIAQRYDLKPYGLLFLKHAL